MKQPVGIMNPDVRILSQWCQRENSLLRFPREPEEHSTVVLASNVEETKL